MVADTIIIVLVCIKSAQPAKAMPHKQRNRLQTKEGNTAIELLISQQCYKAYVEGNTLLFTDAIKVYVIDGSNLNIDDKDVYVSNETIHI